MRKLTRLGTITLALSLSLALLAIIRGGNTDRRDFISAASPKSIRQFSSFCVPRDLTIEVDTEENANMNLTDPSGTVVLNVANVSSGDAFTLHLERRGTYTLSLFNPTNKTSNLRVYLTMFNLESDILQASIILATVGAVMIISQRAYSIARRTR
jgi:hypothetical protein